MWAFPAANALAYHAPAAFLQGLARPWWRVPWLPMPAVRARRWAFTSATCRGRTPGRHTQLASVRMPFLRAVHKGQAVLPCSLDKCPERGSRFKFSVPNPPTHPTLPQVSFFMRKGADVLSKWVGEAERQLRLLFEEAQRHQPSIIFFDEIDGLAPVRLQLSARDCTVGRWASWVQDFNPGLSGPRAAVAAQVTLCAMLPWR